MVRKILIVDDEVEQIELASIVLESSGYTPITAMDGKEAMKKVKAEKPDLIILDIMMPEQGGIGMYHDLKHDDETKNIPVVIVTGIAKVDSGPLGAYLRDIMMSQDQGTPAPDGYIEKPMNADAMLKMVSDLLS